jgi:four helix bundle protein
MLILSHKKLEVWKKSVSFVAMIYKITSGFPKSEIYGIVNQMRRASVSIASNIAEGCARKSAIERKRFYEIARSSLVEIDTQLEISVTLNYINPDKNNDLLEIEKTMNSIFAMITKLIENTK